MKFIKIGLMLFIGFFLIGCDPTERTLESIELAENLEENYLVEEFDISSIQIRLMYSDGSTEIVTVTQDMLSNTDRVKLNGAGTHTIRIQYLDKVLEVTITLNQEDLSAFEIVYQLGAESGFITVTYEEWLESIKGEEGKSAYEIFLTYFSYDKTEEEWLIDLIEGTLSTGETHHVTFDSQGGSEFNGVLVVLDGSTVELPIPEKEGYRFIGWFLGTDINDAQFFNNTVVREDLTLYARYTLKEYTVTYQDHDGTVLYKEVVKHGYNMIGTVDSNIIGAREGHTFIGWDKEVGFVTSDITVTAMYEVMTFYVSFYTNANISYPALENVEYESTITLPKLPNNSFGEVFLGWYLEYDLLTPAPKDMIVRNNVTLFAKWGQPIKDYNTVQEVKEQIDLNPSGITVEFVGVVIGFDSSGYAHVSDETGSIYVRAIHPFLTKGATVSVEGVGYIYPGTTEFPEYTRQIQAANIKVSLYSERTITPKATIHANTNDFLVDGSTDYKGSMLHGNVVRIRGVVQTSSSKFSFYLLDDFGNQIAGIHHYSFNFNNQTTDSSQNVFLGLDGKEVIMTAIVYRFYTKENIWTLQCIGLEEDVVETSSASTNMNLNILSVNDLHGYILQDEYGMNGYSNMAYLINQIRNQNIEDDVVLIGNGDLLQGTAISNMTQGRAVIDVMSQLQFDAMGVGNHEFDWGIDTIFQYFDGDVTNGEASFPLLNANIYRYSDNQLMGLEHENVLEYTVTEKEGVSIGIISYIGDVYTSIAYDQVQDYYFDLEIASSVMQIATSLKQDGVDVVIVNIHGGSSNIQGYWFNQQLAQLQDQSGTYLVDAVINGHTHSYASGSISRNGAAPLPLIQAGGNGNAFGQIVLSLDLNEKAIHSASSSYVYISSAGTNHDETIESMIQSTLGSLDNYTLGVAGETITGTSQLLNWSMYVMLEAANADIAFTNTGSIRSTGGIQTGEDVTIMQLYEVMPFDNSIWVMEVEGAEIESFMNTSSITYVLRPGLIFDRNATYTIAVNSYIYYFSQLDTVRSSEDYTLNALIRDVMEEDIVRRHAMGKTFKPIAEAYLESQVIPTSFLLDLISSIE